MDYILTPKLAELYDTNGTPKWANTESLALFAKYCQPTESPLDLHMRLADTAESIYPELTGLADALMHALGKGWLGPATPVAVNFGTEKRGLPVSCFGLTPLNSIHRQYGIFDTARIAATMAKNGGGLGIDISGLEGASPSAEWAKLYDVTAQLVNQGSIRRGAVAIYMDARNDSIEQFLASADLRGDHNTKLNCNIAVKFDDDFMEAVLSTNGPERKLFADVLALRLRTGSPYIQFSGNVARNLPDCYIERGLDVKHSQLCTEILLHDSPDTAYSCVLSSLNVAKFDEWSGWVYEVAGRKFTLPGIAVLFLDAVTQEFISKASKIEGYQSAVRGATLGRPLGLGIMGLHTLYQKRGYAFGSVQVYSINKSIAGFMLDQAKQASRFLADQYGEPEWCTGSGLRNTHLLAVAPTLSNSTLCCAGSAGVTPLASNLFAYEGANGIHVRKNKQLADALAPLGLDTPAIWDRIQLADGSVQRIAEIPEHIKEVFRIGRELDQLDIIKQAADRQAIWKGQQGQSINLFITPETPPQLVWKYHIEAWKQGLCTLYYVYSRSTHSKVATTLAQQKPKKYQLNGRDSCPWCVLAKELFEAQGIEYTYKPHQAGKVPLIYVDGELLGGYEELLKHLGLDALPSVDCESCDG